MLNGSTKTVINLQEIGGFLIIKNLQDKFFVLHFNKIDYMKKLLLSLFVSFLTLVSFSQTPIHVYVIHQGCPYGITDTWSSQCGAGNMTLDSVDFLGFQDLYHFQIQDTCYPIQLTMCVYVGATQPPYPPQNPFCLTQQISGGGAITLLADCSILNVNEIFIDRKLVKIVDVMGNISDKKENEFLFYIYDDGYVEKKYLVK